MEKNPKKGYLVCFRMLVTENENDYRFVIKPGGVFMEYNDAFNEADLACSCTDKYNDDETGYKCTGAWIEEVDVYESSGL